MYLSYVSVASVLVVLDDGQLDDEGARRLGVGDAEVYDLPAGRLCELLLSHLAQIAQTRTDAHRYSKTTSMSSLDLLDLDSGSNGSSLYNCWK